MKVIIDISEKEFEHLKELNTSIAIKNVIVLPEECKNIKDVSKVLFTLSEDMKCVQHPQRIRGINMAYNLLKDCPSLI